MKKKFKDSILINIILIAVAVIFLILGNNSNTVMASEVVDSAYYVEANGNVFITIAKLCDDACYFLISGILNIIEKIFETLLG